MVKLTQLMDWAVNSALADVLLRQRARSVFYRAGLFRHLPLTGLMLEVGAGTGHIGEAVLRRMPSRQCVMVDPVQRPPRAPDPAHGDAGFLRRTGGYGHAPVCRGPFRRGLGQLCAASPDARRAGAGRGGVGQGRTSRRDARPGRGGAA